MLRAHWALAAAVPALGVSLALAAGPGQDQQPRPGVRVEVEPAGNLIRLPAHEMTEGDEVKASAEGNYTVQAGDVIEIECYHPFTTPKAERGEGERVAIHTEGPEIVGLPPDGFRNVEVMKLDEDGQPEEARRKMGHAVAHLRALKPGEAMVELYVGRDTFTYQFKVTEPREVR